MRRALPVDDQDARTVGLATHVQETEALAQPAAPRSTRGRRPGAREAPVTRRRRPAPPARPAPRRHRDSRQPRATPCPVSAEGRGGPPGPPSCRSSRSARIRRPSSAAVNGLARNATSAPSRPDCDHRVARVAAHEEHANARALFEERRRERRAVLAGQPHVRDQQWDRARLRGGKRDPFCRVPGRDDLVAEPLERQADDGPDRRLVFHDEDLLALARKRVRGEPPVAVTRRRPLPGAGRDRNANPARARFHGEEIATRLLRDAVGGSRVQAPSRGRPASS